MPDHRPPTDIAAWLEALGLGRYAGVFAENDIDGDILDKLSADDLKDLGVASLGHRKRLLEAIAARRDDVAPRPTAPSPAAAPAADIAGQRRQVTILFADLSGFTALSRTMDPEDLHDLAGRYATLVGGIVVAYGGTVDKHIGDAVMALFGAPVAHGDDPLRAARAALDIHAGVAQLGRDFGRELSAHLGIASGEVVAGDLAAAGRREYTVHGDSVNLAARLVAIAKPGQTLVSDAVQRALAGHAKLDPLPAVTMKGFDAQVAVWALRSVAPDAAAVRTPFVGRRRELEQFNAMLASCVDGESGQVAFIRGDPGIGKSRLVGEMLRLAAARDCLAQRVLIFDFGTGKGQDAIRALVRGALGLAGDAPEPLRRAAREQALAAGWVPAGDTVFLDDFLDLTPTIEARALYDAMANERRNLGKRQALAKLLGNLARQRPWVIAVEDVHWADPLTLQMLAGIAIAVQHAPALLLLTSRVQGDPLGGAWRGSIAGTPLTTIDLGPLRADEAASLAGSFVSATHRVALACIERAGGNPLFLEQLLRHAEDGATEAVPGSIQSLVLARMDLLAVADRIALQAASVLGQRFDLATLRHLLDDAAYDCAALAAHALVLPEGGSFLFAHALVQEGVYSSLLKVRRRELHLRAAQWYGERDPVLHAQHLDRAEDAAAASAYRAAAQEQRERYQCDRALELVERGLAIATATADRFELTCLAGELKGDLGATGDSIAAFRAALQLAGDDAGRCRAGLGLASALRIADEPAEALAVLDEAQAAAGRCASAAELARAHHLRGNIYFPLGRIDDCRSEHELGLRYAREAASPEAEARAWGGLGDAAYIQGRMRTAFGNFSRCVELAAAHGLGRIEVAHRSMVGFSRLFQNELREALADGVASTEAAARVGQPRAEMLGLGLQVFSLIEGDEWETAATPLALAKGISQRLGARRFEAQHLELEGRILVRLGRGADGRRALADSVALSRNVAAQFMLPAALGALALATEDAADQRRLLDEGEALLRAGAVAHNHLWFYRDAIEIAIARGAWQEAKRYADSLDAYTRPEPLPWSTLFAARARALAAWATGPRDAAAAAALEAVRAELATAGLRTYLPAVEAALAPAGH